MDSTEASTPVTAAPAIKPLLRKSRRIYNFPTARLDSCRRRLFEDEIYLEKEFPDEDRGMSRSPEFIPSWVCEPTSETFEQLRAEAAVTGASPTSSLKVNIDEDEEANINIVQYNRESNAEDWLEIPINNLKYLRCVVKCWKAFIEVTNLSIQLLEYTPDVILECNSFAKVTDLLHMYNPQEVRDRTVDELNFCNFMSTAARIRRIELRRRRNLGGPLLLTIPSKPFYK